MQSVLQSGQITLKKYLKKKASLSHVYMFLQTKSQNLVCVLKKRPDNGQTSKGILLSGLTNFQDSKTQRTRSQLSTP